MSDNEYERFEVTDYDLDNEFNPNRPRRRLTKNQQIYGIWADNESDSDGPSTSRARRNGGLGSSSRSRPKDYSAPISFVSAGIINRSKKKSENDDKPEDDDDQITDEEVDERPSFGQKPIQELSGESSDSSDSSGHREAEVRNIKQAPSTFRHESSKIGAWEQHTRGIGAKLLMQMGFKPGKGLGKNLQGKATPVEAHKPRGRAGIGVFGSEKVDNGPDSQKKPIEDEDVREAKEFKAKLNKWKKAGDPQQSKAKRYYYKSVEEVIEKGKKSNLLSTGSLSKQLGNVPVIDMTGPEKRVLSGYHALGHTKMIEEETQDVKVHFALPELMHNLNLIVGMCEQDIIALDKAENAAIDRQAALEHESKNLREILALEKNHIETLEKVSELVDELTNSDDSLSLERAEEIIVDLKTNYEAEYKEFVLSELAAGIVAPILKNALDEWQPLEKPNEHVDLVKRWRNMLVDGQSSQKRSIFDPYSSIVWTGVVSRFRACISQWNPREYRIMATLLDCWAPILPDWILDAVLEQIVLPRLTEGVSHWNPLTDTVPIHVWILPWHALLGDKMEKNIYPAIREKLGVALQAWIPQDRSARAMLLPWKDVFDTGTMQLFLNEHIIPKLQLAMNTLIINPLQQDLEPWNQVWEWHDLITPMAMDQLLDKHFFPKWLQVLVIWLNQAPNYTEISRWYMSWKNLLSPEVLREPNVQNNLRRALELMQRATGFVLDSSLGAAPSSTANSVPTPQPPMSKLPMPSSTSQLEFKELVSQKCAERGIVFAPVPGKRELGKQVYRAGRFFCYIDRNVCMLSDASLQNWSPTSLQDLINKASG